MIMRLSRREFLQLASAFGITAVLPLDLISKALAGKGLPPVIWLQGLSCSGCSVSLLNSVNLTTIDDLLVNKINLEYHSTLVAAAGDVVFSDMAKQGYILVVEGSIPFNAQGKYCYVGSDMTMLQAFDRFSSAAGQIIAMGTCASFGGVAKAKPNPTGAKSVAEALVALGHSKPLINIPGCPAHPDWFVGTVLYLLAGQTVKLDSQKRPLMYFTNTVHSRCFRRGTDETSSPGRSGCLREVGCRGPQTYANCPDLKWNSPGRAQKGVNWCVQAQTPCHGCTEPGFPDSMTPFIRLGDGEGDGGGGEGGDD
jgi:hydrogenase small subunit